MAETSIHSTARRASSGGIHWWPPSKYMMRCANPVPASTSSSRYTSS